jgi:choline-glycine betaine transporter
VAIVLLGWQPPRSLQSMSSTGLPFTVVLLVCLLIYRSLRDRTRAIRKKKKRGRRVVLQPAC